MRELVVGRQSAGFIQRGHPWVRRDRFTRGLEQLQPGEPVTLVDERGRGLASALADPEATICARVFHKRPGKSFDPQIAIERAWERRADLHADPLTNVYRIVHGEADFLPGLRVERYADVLVILLRSAALDAWSTAVVDQLQRCLPQARMVIKHQLDDLRKAPLTTQMADGQPTDASSVVWVKELGVSLLARPFGDLATGVYCDQRATRMWLHGRAQGASIINLFAYTGAFSASLLAHGAQHAIDVDLAAPALADGAANIAENGLTARYQQHHADCMRWLEDGSRTADIIIADPPTAAAGGGRGWVLRRDYPRLLRLAAKRLAPGGTLLACCNTLGDHRLDLERLAAEHLGHLHNIPAPSPAADIPSLKGFPEGTPWHMLALEKPPV